MAEFKRNSREQITIDGLTKSRYEWTQEQRRIETAIRYQKDIAILAKAAGDIVARRECAYMIRELDKYYGKITDAAGLKAQKTRAAVSNFRWVKPADALKNPTKHDIMALDKRMPAVRSLSNKQARAWYLEHDARIPSMIDRNASIEEQARQAFVLRNLYRTIARDLMHDQETRKYLDETQPNKTFEQMIEHKKSKGMTYEEALQDIVRTATKTNAKVNKELGLE